MVCDQLALGVIQRADLGGRHAARRAVEQPRTQLLFQLHHQFGGRGLAHAHVGRGLAERAEVNHANEKPDGLNAVHGRK
jgi:hypothetical protein